jgi:hypothetical protein
MIDTTVQRKSYTLTYIVWLLSTAMKVRLAGLIILLFAFLINCYFILFDQQSYIAFLERFSPDGTIRDINAVFFRILKLIIYLCIAWVLATNKAIIDSFINESKHALDTDLHWWHRKSPYIIACSAWLVISYLPFLFFDYKTMRALSLEDKFYESSSFLWLFLTSMSFLYLFYKKNVPTSPLKTKRQISFLLLGLLFFFGAGEEISWGQRIFHFQTPEILSSNLQDEFNLHNLPLFDKRIAHDEVKKGLALELAMGNLFGVFWFSFCVLIPILHIVSNRIHKWLDKLDFPITPIWIGLFFMGNHLIYYKMLQYIASFPIVYPMSEIREAAYSFFFFILTIWFINSPGQRRGYHHKSSSNV